MAKVIREKEMAVSVGALYRAITEFEKYPTFLNEVVGATLLPDSNKECSRVKFEIEVVKRFVYVLEFRMKDQVEVAWSLVESDFFKQNQGKWLLKSQGEAKTQVSYELDVGFGFLVPSWVSKKLTEVNLPKMFESFETQAQKIASGA